MMPAGLAKNQNIVNILPKEYTNNAYLVPGGVPVRVLPVSRLTLIIIPVEHEAAGYVFYRA